MVPIAVVNGLPEIGVSAVIVLAVVAKVAGTQGDTLKAVLNLLPKVGEVVERPKPISLPTDGTVYDPELAHCCSCEPERAAAISIRLETQKAEALKVCLEAQVLQVELERRRLLLQKGELGPFEAAPAAQQVPNP